MHPKRPPLPVCPARTPAPHVRAAVAASTAQAKLGPFPPQSQRVPLPVPPIPVNRLPTAPPVNPAGEARPPRFSCAPSRSATLPPPLASPRSSPTGGAHPHSQTLQPAGKKVAKSVFNTVFVKVPSFSSKYLKRAFEKKTKLKITSGSDIQVHHKIPKSLEKLSVLKDFNFDQSNNAIPLRGGKSSEITMGSTHRGSHPNYNKAVKSVLEKLESKGYHSREIQHAVMEATDRILSGGYFTLSFKEKASDIEKIIMNSIEQSYSFSPPSEIDKLEDIEE